MAKRIVIVADRSGSMSNQRDEFLDGINSQLANLKEKFANNETVVTLITFNSKVKVVWEGIPLKHAPELTREDYVPEGKTALYEAMIKALNRFKDEKKNIMLILTDGQENASGKEYTRDLLAEKLQEYQKLPYDWNFMYLCENPEQFEEASSMGLKGKNTNNIKVEDGKLGATVASDTTKDVLTSYMQRYI